MAEETLGEAIVITFDQEAKPSTGDLRDKEGAYIKLRVIGHGAVRFTLEVRMVDDTSPETQRIILSKTECSSEFTQVSLRRSEDC